MYDPPFYGGNVLGAMSFAAPSPNVLGAMSFAAPSPTIIPVIVPYAVPQPSFASAELAQSSYNPSAPIMMEPGAVIPNGIYSAGRDGVSYLNDGNDRYNSLVVPQAGYSESRWFKFWRIIRASVMAWIVLRLLQRLFSLSNRRHSALLRWLYHSTLIKVAGGAVILDWCLST